MTIPSGPWKVILAGNQWGISRAKAARGEDDICMGSKYRDNWEDIAKAIAALPAVLDALIAVDGHAGIGEPLRGQIRAALKAAGRT